MKMPDGSFRSAAGGVRVGFWLLAGALMVHTAGCASKPKTPPKPPTVPVLRLSHHLGGTQYRSIIDGNYCYQTFGSNLLVMPTGDITPLKTIELGKSGETGPATDMLLHNGPAGKHLWIVIRDDELLELSLDLAQAPSVVSRTPASRLGIRPRRLSTVDGDLYVSGPGGIVRVRDNQRIFTSDQDVSRVVRAEGGLVACIGRQAIRISDGKFVGSATDFPLATPTQIVFVRQGEEGGLVGLMTEQVREVDTHRATVAVPGLIRSVRMINDRLWIASDRTTVGYRMDDNALTDPQYIDLLGAFDVAPVDENHLAICGSFGRATCRLTETEQGDPPGFVKIHREPSRLSMAVSDGRHILAGGVEGLWMYLINSRVDLTTRQFENPPPPPQTRASVAGGTATISEDRRSISITSTAVDPKTGSKASWTLRFADVAFDSGRALGTTSGTLPQHSIQNLPDGLIHCVEAVDGDFWVGHDRGITVVKAPARPEEEKASKKERHVAPPTSVNRIAGRLRIHGAELYL